MLLVATFTPQLPPVFGRSEFHINILAFCLACIGFFVWHRNFPGRKSIILIVYFSVFQILLIFSSLFGPEGLSNFNEMPSLFRPVMLFVVAALFVLLINESDAFETCMSVSIALTLISFFYAILEVFAFSSFSPLMHAFYRLSDKSNIDGVSVSFFTLPYYAAYVHSILLLFVLCALSYKRTFFRFLVLLMSLSNIVLTQSKTGIFVAFLSLFMYWFMSADKRARWFVALFGSALCSVIMYFMYDAIKFLSDAVGGNFAYSTMLILERPEEAGNLVERTRQVSETFELLWSGNLFIGIGLGKGLTIESWLAYVPYRYGVIGLVFFVGFYLLVGIRSLYLSLNIEDLSSRLIARAVGIWAICLFFTQLSSLSMEVSKASIFTGLMLAFASTISIKRVVKLP